MNKSSGYLQRLQKLKLESRHSDLLYLVSRLRNEGYPSSILDFYDHTEKSGHNIHPYEYPWPPSTRDLGSIGFSPKVSIVIISYNSGGDLDGLVPTIVNQSYVNWELILVENGALASDSIVSRYIKNFSYISADNPGFAEANNLALEACTGELILLLNPDTQLRSDTLKELVHEMALDVSAAAACPKIYFSSEFLKIDLTSEGGIPFSLDIEPYLRRVSYGKFFVRHGIFESGTSISSSSGRISLDIAIESFESEVEILLFGCDLREKFAAIYVSFEGCSDYPQVYQVSSNPSLFNLKLSKSILSGSRRLLNNCGSSLRSRSRQPYDVGFGEVDHGQYSGKSYREAFCGCCVLLRRDLFIQRKIFISEFFAYYEDSELSFWIRSNKMNILYAPSAIVYHKHSESTKDSDVFRKYLIDRSSSIYKSVTTYPGYGNLKFNNNVLKYSHSLAGEDSICNTLRRFDSKVAASSLPSLVARTEKKVVGIYNSYWDSFGGGEKHALDFCVLALNLGYDVFLISENEFSIQELSSYFGINLTGARKLVTRCVTESLTQRFDIFINACYCSSLVSRAIKSYYLVSFPHQQVPDQFLKSYLFIHNSQYTSGWANKFWGEHKSCIINPVLGFGTRASLGDSCCQDIASRKQKILLCVGRFNYEGHCKNHHIIANAYKQLCASGDIGDDWKLVIAGSVNHFDQSSVVHYNDVQRILEGTNAQVLANLSREELNVFYEQSSIYIHAAGLLSNPRDSPNAFEHFGISVFEALLNGCIPIVHSVGGPSAQVLSSPVKYQYSTVEGLCSAIKNAVFFVEKVGRSEYAEVVSTMINLARKVIDDSQASANALMVKAL